MLGLGRYFIEFYVLYFYNPLGIFVKNKDKCTCTNKQDMILVFFRTNSTTVHTYNLYKLCVQKIYFCTYFIEKTTKNVTNEKLIETRN